MKANSLPKQRKSIRSKTSTGELERIRHLDYLNREEAAIYLGLSPKTIWTHTRRGLLPHARIGGLIKYSKQALQEMMAKLQTRSSVRK
jgi:excisionase family DNA binding protein